MSFYALEAENQIHALQAKLDELRAEVRRLELENMRLEQESARLRFARPADAPFTWYESDGPAHAWRPSETRPMCGTKRSPMKSSVMRPNSHDRRCGHCMRMTSQLATTTTDDMYETEERIA